MPGRVEGKTVLITGAASGLGRAYAIRLAAEGAMVVVTDREEAGARETVETIGDRGHFIQMDVTSEADWVSAMGEVKRLFGKLDVLVNNAGIAPVTSLEKCTLEEWRRVNAVCSEGTFLGCKHALPLMAGGGGSIINIASIAALVGVPDVIAYSAAKGAVRAFSRSVAIHCARARNGVRCNSIYPGGMETPMAVASRSAMAQAPGPKPVFTPIGKPEDVAAAVLFLASDESRWINGAEIVIDHGVSSAAGQLPS